MSLAKTQLAYSTDDYYYKAGGAKVKVINKKKTNKQSDRDPVLSVLHFIVRQPLRLVDQNSELSKSSWQLGDSIFLTSVKHQKLPR